MTTQERLNELLDLACEHYGVTKDRQLAPHLGVDASSIWRWRNGLMLSPQADAILKILNIAFPGPLPITAAAEVM